MSLLNHFLVSSVCGDNGVGIFGQGGSYCKQSSLVRRHDSCINKQKIFGSDNVPLFHLHCLSFPNSLQQQSLMIEIVENCCYNFEGIWIPNPDISRKESFFQGIPRLKGVVFGQTYHFRRIFVSEVL